MRGVKYWEAWKPPEGRGASRSSSEEDEDDEEDDDEDDDEEGDDDGDDERDGGPGDGDDGDDNEDVGWGATCPSDARGASGSSERRPCRWAYRERATTSACATWMARAAPARNRFRPPGPRRRRRVLTVSGAGSPRVEKAMGM